jgi:hypothetical protein
VKHAVAAKKKPDESSSSLEEQAVDHLDRIISLVAAGSLPAANNVPAGSSSAVSNDLAVKRPRKSPKKWKNPPSFSETEASRILMCSSDEEEEDIADF